MDRNDRPVAWLAAAPDLHRVWFERWPDPDGAHAEVGGVYSRKAWLPVVGAATWLTWKAVADRLQGRQEVDSTLEEIGQPSSLPVCEVSWGLLQMERYDLARAVGEDRWRVHAVCPPLHDALLPRAAEAVQRYHRRTVPPEACTIPATFRWGRVLTLAPVRRSP